MNDQEMKYLPLGKITYSNNSEYIGCFLEISEFNYNRLKTLMDNCLIDHNFETHLNDFSYHLIEEIEEEYNSKRKFLVNKSFTLYVLYTIKKIIEFQLFYDSTNPIQLPVNIYIKEIFKPSMYHGGESVIFK
jgi:hypothetical protein